ncbi:MAG: hypothetical protein A6F71_01280 [Cycloclasticus sp. symbiont of Poecilosclerida sp. M]|nr:MAG: hypothetical protein A6F71_01280 [Cycloclasticus sp. symbiont of Poecilosclerida sp. M]
MNAKLSAFIIFILLLPLWVTAGSSAPNNKVTEPSFFHSFSGSIVSELDQIKEQTKTGVVLFFSTQHCRFCKRMKATVFNQRSVQEYYRQHFRILELDIESDTTLVDELAQTTPYLDYAKRHRVRLTPTIVFLNHAGETVYRHVGMIADPQEFIWLAEYVVSNQTRKQNFTNFKINKRQQVTAP